MDFILSNSEENKDFLINNEFFSSLDNKKSKNTQILQGMSPKEIADIVSDHLINIVKKQFQVAKEKYQKENGIVKVENMPELLPSEE